MAGITWLHLSDWHQSGRDFDRQVVRDALLLDIKNRAAISPDLERIDLIIFSGDLANRGKPEEYQAAADFLLEPVREAVGLGTDRIVVIPGNHDIDRSLLEFAPCTIARPFKDASEVNKWLEDPKRRSRLLEPFEAFTAFATRYLGPARSADAHVVRMDIAGIPVAVVALNSALMCGRNKDAKGEVDDEKCLVVGEPQVYTAVKEAANARIIIGVVHHPFEWLAPFDRQRVEDAMCRGCHFILSGHLHNPRIHFVSGSSGDYVTIPAGASYDRRDTPDTRYMNSYNFVHLNMDEDAREGASYFRRWSDQRGKWLKHEDLVDDGLFRFRIPRQPPVVRKPVAAPAARTTDYRQFRTFREQQFILVPEGPFTIGTRPGKNRFAVPSDRLRAEQPARRIDVGTFYLGRFPVTNAQYERFVRETGHEIPFRDDPLSRRIGWDAATRTYLPGRASHPVVLVSWQDALEFCRWMGGRLPTEAEWEKAARGGKLREWPWGDTWQDQFSNTAESNINDTTPVGSYSPRGDSEFGVADLAGNVMEWCSTLYLNYPYKQDDGRESVESPGPRVVRGGAWALDRVAARCAFRIGVDPFERGPTIGFRVAFDELPG